MSTGVGVPIAHLQNGLIIELARRMVLGALLTRVRERWGGYELIDHWQQGEFHHERAQRVSGGISPKAARRWMDAAQESIARTRARAEQRKARYAYGLRMPFAAQHLFA